MSEYGPEVPLQSPDIVFGALDIHSKLNSNLMKLKKKMSSINKAEMTLTTI